MCVEASEYNIICEMQVIDREVFYYLVQRMDSRGFIGRKPEVSYGGMANDLSERVRPGRQADLITFSSKQIQNAVARLVSSDIFERLSGNKKGCNLVLRRVFFADSNDRHKSVQNQYGIYMGFNWEGTDTEKISTINKLVDSKRPNMGGICPKYGTTNILHLHHRSDEPFSMTLKWQPDDQELKAALFRAFGSRFKIDDIKQTWIAEFVMYWTGRKDKLTQTQWNLKLAKLIIVYLSNPGEFERRQGLRPADAKQSAGHYQRNSSHLPEWARMPRNEAELISWSMRHGYGEADTGDSMEAFKGKLRRKINERLEQANMKKIVY